jgi:hypothetical protein
MKDGRKSFYVKEERLNEQPDAAVTRKLGHA